MLTNLERLGPALEKAAQAAKELKTVFSDSKTKTDNLLVELQETEGNLKKSQGEI